MPFASVVRRRCLQIMFGSAGLVIAGRSRHAVAEPAAAEPIQELCNALLNIMRSGRSTPFQQRFSQLSPVVDRVFDLSAILQVSVGLGWSNLPPDQQGALMNAFRRYTIANYVNSFDNYTGQRFDVQPQTRSLPNGEQLAQSRIISPSGESHELDYVMRQVGRSWKAVDVLADGSISRVAVQRSDFRSLLARGGAPALIESLNRKTSDLSGGALT